MKITTILLLVTLGLVCSAYAAPIDDNEDTVAQFIRPFPYRHVPPFRPFPSQKLKELINGGGTVQDYGNDDAEAQIAPALLLGASLLGPMLGKMIGGEVAVQDYDKDDADAQIAPALLLGASLLGPMLGKMIGGEVAVQDYDNDDADAQIAPALLLGASLLGPMLGKMIGGEAAAQDDDDDDDQIEALLQSLQDEADMEGFGKTIKKIGKGTTKVGKKYGPSVLKGAKKYGKKFGERYGEQILDSLVGRLFPPSGGSDYEEGDDAALLQDKAETEGFGRMLGKLGKGATKVGKNIGERYGEQILDSLVDTLVNGK